MSLALAKEVEEANAGVAKARSLFWRALALAYDEMTEQWVEGLLNGAVTAALSEATPWLGSGKERFAGGLEVMKQFVKQHQDQDPHEILRDLKAEYARLFIGPGAVLAPARESAYRDWDTSSGTATVQDLWAASVEAVYRRHGLSLYPCHRDLPDHVATELVFMYFLSRQEAEAWEKGQAETAKGFRRAQLGFLGEHLVRWLPDFCERVQNATRSNVYWALADMLREFLVAETGRVMYSQPCRTGPEKAAVETLAGPKKPRRMRW